MKTPIRYAGGKSKAYKTITPLIPADVKKIVSPFVGGGSLEVKWATENGIDVIGFDIFDILINYWQHQLKKPQQIYNILAQMQPSKDHYKQIKEELMCVDVVQNIFKGLKTKYYNRNPVSMNKDKLAAYYFYNHNLSYGPMFLGWYSSLFNDHKKYSAAIERVRDFKAPTLQVEEGNFDGVIDSHKNEFLYLDPPYFLEKDDDNKMLKGMYPNCNFAIHHNSFDHKKLRDLLHSHNGRFIMSYNNCETIRDWYKDFRLEYPSWQYSYANGERRIGKNKKNNISEPLKEKALSLKNKSEMWALHDVEESEKYMSQYHKIWHTKESHEILIIKD